MSSINDSRLQPGLQARIDQECAAAAAKHQMDLEAVKRDAEIATTFYNALRESLPINVAGKAFQCWFESNFCGPNFTMIESEDA